MLIKPCFNRFITRFIYLCKILPVDSSCYIIVACQNGIPRAYRKLQIIFFFVTIWLIYNGILISSV